MYGFALVISPLFGEAFTFGREHLVPLPPFVAEFCRSSMTTFMEHVVQAPLPTSAMDWCHGAAVQVHLDQGDLEAARCSVDDLRRMDEIFGGARAQEARIRWVEARLAEQQD